MARRSPIPILDDINLQIEFLRFPVDIFRLRSTRPTGWEKEVLRIEHRASEIWEGIRSGDIKVFDDYDAYDKEIDHTREAKIRQIEELSMLRDLQGMTTMTEVYAGNALDFDNEDCMINELNELEGML